MPHNDAEEMDEYEQVAFVEPLERPMATKGWFFKQMELYCQERERKDALQHEQNMKMMREMM